MGLVTGFGPVTVTQTGAARLVVDCNVKPVALVGQVTMTLVPARKMASSGSLTAPNDRLNTVPSPEPPPNWAVPYRVPPDRTKPASGVVPSLLKPETSAEKL